MHIDELLNISYTGYEPAVPAFAWDGIAAKLDKKDNKKGFWWKVAVLAALLTGVATVMYFSGNSDSTEMAAPENSALPSVGENQSSSPADAGKGDDSKHASGENTASSTHTQAAKLPLNKKAETQADHKKAVENKTKSVVTEQVSVKAGSNLASFGVRSENMNYSTESLRLPDGKLKLQILPPTTIMGARTFVGLGVGQSVSATGFSVNPDFGNYVHKNFTKRMSEGEGLISSLNFSGIVAYRLGGIHYIYSGANFYQRRNSLSFNFKDEAPALNSAGNVERDKFGNYPIKGYLSSGSGVEVNFNGTNTFTSVDIPVGWMAQVPLGRNYTFIPAAAAGLGFLSLNATNSTLNYQLLEVEKLKSEWYRKTYVLMNTSAGLYKNIGLRVKLGVNASAGYTLSQMYVPGSPIRPRAFTGGLSTQLIWRLD